jgi:hypothetical protein
VSSEKITANTVSSHEISCSGTTAYALDALQDFVPELAAGRAAAYIGSGASVSSGYPKWDELLTSIQFRASGRLRNDGEDAERYFSRLKEKYRNLEVGDWLLNVGVPDLLCRWKS